jgi:hypothetical protein
MAMKRFLYIPILLASLLAGCSTENQQPQLEALAYPPILQNLKGLVPPHLLLYDGSQNVDLNPNCPVNEFNMPGQGYRVDSSAGGLSYAPLTHSKTPFAVGQGVRSDFFAALTPAMNASIIIADDFKNDVYALGSQVFTQTTLDAATLRALQQNGQLSHGALVFTHVQEVIRGTELYTLDTVASTASKKVYKRQVGTTIKTLTVLAVNTKLVNTQVISTMIKQNLDALGTSQGRATVINMSFGLMPCKVYEDYLKWDTHGLQTFEDYMTRLAGFNGVDYKALVQAVIESTNLPDDPLLKLIKGTSGANYGAAKNIYVGAAGNYSLNYSMYPANWAKVVNVTGSSLDDPTRRDTRFFSQGEVMEVGASLRLDPPVGGKPLYYIGTSFSTPTVSVYSALDVAMTLRCAEIGMNPISELAKDVPALLDRPLETIGATQGAVSVRCGPS